MNGIFESYCYLQLAVTLNWILKDTVIYMIGGHYSDKVNSTRKTIEQLQNTFSDILCRVE